MKSKCGIIGSFISMFVATILIVIALVLLVVASGIIKESIRKRDNFGVQNETDVGIEGLFSYVDNQFNDMIQLRIKVRSDGNWQDWLTGGVKG